MTCVCCLPGETTLIHDAWAKEMSMHTHTTNRSLHEILYGHAPLRRRSIAELSRTAPVVVLFLHDIAADAALADFAWAESALRNCASGYLVIVHPFVDREAESLLAAAGLGHALRICDREGRLQRAFGVIAAMHGSSEGVSGPFVVIGGVIASRPVIDIAPAA
jgi:hypothetical protein